MATASLKQPDQAPPKRSRTEWDAYLRRREDLDEERKRLGRDAAALGKLIGEMDRELMALVDAEAGSERSITLKHFRLSIVQVKKSVSWLTEFTKRLGKELAEELKDNVGTRDSLVIESREKPPAANAA